MLRIDRGGGGALDMTCKRKQKTSFTDWTVLGKLLGCFHYDFYWSINSFSLKSLKHHAVIKVTIDFSSIKKKWLSFILNAEKPTDILV